MISVGVIGLGKMGLRHVNAVLHNEHCQLKYVVDSNPEALVPYDTITSYSHISHFSYRNRPDLVILATPSVCHAAHAMWFQSMGSAVLVEKPISLSVTAANRLGQDTMVSHTERYNPIVRHLLGALGIGAPVRNWSSTRFSLIEPDRTQSGGEWFDLGVHDFDLYRLFTGRNAEIAPPSCQNKKVSTVTDDSFVVGYGDKIAALSFNVDKVRYRVNLRDKSFMCDNAYTACYNSPYDAASMQLADVVSYMESGIKPKFLCCKRDALEAVRCAESANYAEESGSTVVAS